MEASDRENSAAQLGDPAITDEVILGGIVLYNPDLKRLRENIEAVYPQVEALICVDNNSTNIQAIEGLNYRI